MFQLETFMFSWHTLSQKGKIFCSWNTIIPPPLTKTRLTEGNSRICQHCEKALKCFELLTFCLVFAVISTHSNNCTWQWVGVNSLFSFSNPSNVSLKEREEILLHNYILTVDFFQRKHKETSTDISCTIQK